MSIAYEISAGAPVRPPFPAVVEAVARRRADGFAAVWWADHLLHWFPSAIWTPDLVPAAASQPTPHTWADPFVLAAACATQVPDIRFGIGVTDLVRRHPVALAQTALTLDHATGGRFILGVGTGEALNLAPMDMHNPRPLTRLREGLEVMRTLMRTTDEIDYAGEELTVRGAAVGLRPFGDAPPPIWVAAHRPRGLRVAGRLGDGWMPVCIDPAEYAAMWAQVQAAATGAGRAGEVTPAAYVRVVLAEDARDARDAAADALLLRYISLTSPGEVYERHGARHPVGEGMRGISEFLPGDLTRAQALALADQVPAEVVLDTVVAGSPDDVAARLAALVDAGARHIQVVNMSPLASPALAGASDALLGDALQQLRDRARRTA